MAQKFEKEEEELIQSFEASMDNLSNEIFEIHSYQLIVEHYIDRNHYTKALTAVEQAIHVYPFSDELLPLKAQVLSALKRYEEAMALLEQAKLIHPHSIDIYLAKGGVLLEQGKHRDALSLYQEALIYAEEQADDIYYHIGLTYQHLKDYKRAIEAYKKAIRINIQHQQSLYELTYCLDIEGELENNLPYYEKFIDEQPYSPDAWYNLGMVYDKLKKYEQALNAYDYAIIIENTFSNAYFSMGHIYLNLKQDKKALDCFQKTVELEGQGAEIYCAIGMAYANLDQYKLSIQYFRKSTKLDPYYDEAWFGLGNCLANQKKWDQALCFFTKAIKINSHNASYWKAIADSEFKLGNIVSSIKAYEKASLLDPEHWELWLNWSFIYYENSDLKKAIAIINAGLTELPDEPNLLYRLVVYFLESSEYQNALSHLEKALTLNFTGHKVLFNFFPKGKTKQTLQTIINQFKEENP